MKRMIVLRNCPPALADREGWWHKVDFGFETLDHPKSASERVVEEYVTVTFVPTGRFETRDDGAVAEVYEPVEEV